MPLRVSIIRDYNGQEVLLGDSVDPGEASKLISTNEDGIVSVYSIYCTDDDRAGIIYHLEDVDVDREYESHQELIDESEVMAEVHFLGRLEVPIPLGRLAVLHFIYQSLN
jgi:hypothetical protein